jgi:release factor glutamine methyltransferase
VTTLAEAIQQAAARLAAHKVENARLDAEVLLGHALGRDRAWLLVHMQDQLDEQGRLAYENSIGRRAVREPLQYITGLQEFWGLPFIVTSDVLIPRPETELVVEAAVRTGKTTATPVFVDLCTGSGCIAISLAKEHPQARIFATDRSRAALDIARRNALQNGVADRIRFLEGDLFMPLSGVDLIGRIDVITANPPYIRNDEFALLQPEVRDFEPEMALLSGPDGTEMAERIINAAATYLKPGGALIMEMGISQAESLRKFITYTGRYLSTIDILKDLAGIERVIVAKKT